MHRYHNTTAYTPLRPNDPVRNVRDTKWQNEFKLAARTTNVLILYCYFFFFCISYASIDVPRTGRNSKNVVWLGTADTERPTALRWNRSVKNRFSPPVYRFENLQPENNALKTIGVYTFNVHKCAMTKNGYSTIVYRICWRSIHARS